MQEQDFGLNQKIIKPFNQPIKETGHIRILYGNLDEAYLQVMTTLKESFPKMAPWIYESIGKILKNQLNQNSGVHWLTLGLMIYGTVGFSSSLLVLSILDCVLFLNGLN